MFHSNASIAWIPPHKASPRARAKQTITKTSHATPRGADRKRAKRRYHILNTPPSTIQKSTENDDLSTETVESSALSLQSIDNIERGDGLSLGVLGVGDRVSDDILEAGWSAMVERGYGEEKWR
jgi:hypothetical protein